MEKKHKFLNGPITLLYTNIQIIFQKIVIGCYTWANTVAFLLKAFANHLLPIIKYDCSRCLTEYNRKF